MSDKAPTLSVVVNNYNYDKYLEEALDSALRQLKAGDELIIVDDGSTDDSKTILRRYQQLSNCKLIEQRNQGQMNAVRNGVATASGDVVTLLDSDDYYLEGYLDRLRSLFQKDADTNFVFSKPDVSGTDASRIKETRAILEHMTFPPGKVGKTKWGTVLFHEFVGVPTSGLAFRRTLADQILTLPETVDETVSISATKRFLLGVSVHEANKFGFAADAIIVRCASALGADKYYNEQPGFMYRIHGANKYAAVPSWGRWYMRRSRKHAMAVIFQSHFAIQDKPASEEILNEFQQRVLPIHLRRRLRIRYNYTRALISSRGSIAFKLKGILLTTGISRARSSGL